MIPWSLYNLTPRDQGSPLIRPFYFRDSGTVAGPTDSIFSTSGIEADYELLLTMVNMHMERGAGVINYLEWLVDDIAGPPFPLGSFRWSSSFASSSNMANVWMGAPLCLVSDQQQLQFGVVGSAMTNVTYTWSAAGVLIPRGTLSLT